MPVTLPKEKTKPTIDLSSKTILLYGPPKIGKSTTASRFPGAIFLECEPGLNELEVFKMPTYSWEAFKEACKLLEEGKHEFRTIVVDTVDNAFRMCTDFVNAQNAVKYERGHAAWKGMEFGQDRVAPGAHQTGQPPLRPRADQSRAG